jgi:hypothetical protein
MKGIKVDYMLIASIILSFIIVTASFINFAYSQANQMDSNKSNSNNTNADSLNIQNIPARKVHVGDIDIAYKTFGKGDPILLINGYSFTMDSWDPTLLETLASNHT